jgi:hypothetical protein
MASVLLVVGVLSAILTVCYAGGLFHRLLASRRDAADDRLVAVAAQLSAANRTKQPQTPEDFAHEQSTFARA